MYVISNILIKGRIVAKMEIKHFNLSSPQLSSVNPFLIYSPVAMRLGKRKYGNRTLFKSTLPLARPKPGQGHEKLYNLINNGPRPKVVGRLRLNSKKPVKISLSNILSDRNFFLVENNFQY